MAWKADTNQNGVVLQYSNPDTGEIVTAQQYERCMQIQQTLLTHAHSHAFLDATSVAILTPTLTLMVLIIAAAHKKGLLRFNRIVRTDRPSTWAQWTLGEAAYSKAMQCDEIEVWAEIDQLIAKQKDFKR
jgi:hypothetical protein